MKDRKPNSDSTTTTPLGLRPPIYDLLLSPGWTAWVLALVALVGLQALGASTAVLIALAVGIGAGVVGLQIGEAWSTVHRETVWPQTYATRELIGLLRGFLADLKHQPIASLLDSFSINGHKDESRAEPPNSSLGWAVDSDHETDRDSGHCSDSAT